jgi:hypothetical protein
MQPQCGHRWDAYRGCRVEGLSLAPELITDHGQTLFPESFAQSRRSMLYLEIAIVCTLIVLNGLLAMAENSPSKPALAFPPYRRSRPLTVFLLSRRA